MAKYPSITTTKAGLNAISESNASGKALIFTGLLIGSGETPTDIKGLTALVAPRLKIEDITITNNGDGKCTIRGALVNTTLDSGFYAKEIGVLAKVGEEGEEILFSYTNGGNYVDYIPDKSIVMDTYTFTITTVVGNAENITVFVNNDGYATLDDLNDHNEFEGAHRNLFINATDDAEATNNSDKGATTSWVTNKLQKFKSFTSSQISDFKEKVIEIITENIVNILQITYRLDTNGFIKFGLFGGFTIQWGTVTVTTGVADANKISEGEVVFTFPTAFTSAPWAIFTGALDTINVRLESASIFGNTPTKVSLFLHALGAQNVQLSSFVFAIGK